MAQAENLTDAQIDATYCHFEYGEAAPAGVVLADGFRKTMGRYLVHEKDMVYVRNFA